MAVGEAGNAEKRLIPKREVELGGTVSFAQGLEMKDFKSNILLMVKTQNTDQ